MILARIVLTMCGIAMLLMGISTIVMPDVNSFFIPFEVSDKSTATLVRTYAGFFLASGYLTIRFVYSSSRVQIGNVLLYMFGCMLLSRLFSFIYVNSIGPATRYNIPSDHLVLINSLINF